MISFVEALYYCYSVWVYSTLTPDWFVTYLDISLSLAVVPDSDADLIWLDPV